MKIGVLSDTHGYLHPDAFEFFKGCDEIWHAGDIMDDFNVRFFADEATIDGNLASLDHALDRVGSRRVMNLHTSVDDDATWSLFLVNRHEVRTQCIILPPEQQ